ncbi:glutamate--cysteine ligase catalytic subunit-like [Liolophura sinensis]|uniref:glutamate--cysteine ligase catalytic subunit-like n=1 Tax=Liolophura sinensis TaxID=3198878 RepID=UPI00315850F1
MPEFSEFQLETIPPRPYSGRLEDLGAVEDNMEERLGREMDDKLNGIKQIFQDVNTQSCHGNNGASCDSDHVTIGGISIATSCSGLQVTIQAKSLQEARYLHDQLAVLSPVLICLTVATPVAYGLVKQNDSRLGMLLQAQDDRTEEERKPVVDANGEVRHMLPRSGLVPWYLSDEGQHYNDLKLVYNAPVHHTCVRKGIDMGMAMHTAILFSHAFYAVKENEMMTQEKDSTQLFEVTMRTLMILMSDSKTSSAKYEEMSIDDIVNGSPMNPGLLSLVHQFLDTRILQTAVRQKVDSYLHMISQTASGERPTVARRIRELVLNHPEYKKDSKVTENIQYDIVKAHLLDRL